jgi:hypothetical protein
MGFLDSLNLYLYVKNNPLNLRDSTGLTSENFAEPMKVYIQNEPGKWSEPITATEVSADQVNIIILSEGGKIETIPAKVITTQINIEESMVNIITGSANLKRFNPEYSEFLKDFGYENEYQLYLEKFRDPNEEWLINLDGIGTVIPRSQVEQYRKARQLQRWTKALEHESTSFGALSTIFSTIARLFTNDPDTIMSASEAGSTLGQMVKKGGWGTRKAATAIQQAKTLKYATPKIPPRGSKRIETPQEFEQRLGK